MWGLGVVVSDRKRVSKMFTNGSHYTVLTFIVLSDRDVPLLSLFRLNERSVQCADG